MYMRCRRDSQVIKQAFIIERIHFHRKLFSGFVFCWFISCVCVGAFFAFSFISLLSYIQKHPSSMYGAFSQIDEANAKEFHHLTATTETKPEKKSMQLISYLEMRTQHLFVHLILMTEKSHFCDFHTIFDKFARKIIITIPLRIGCVLRRVAFVLHLSQTHDGVSERASSFSIHFWRAQPTFTIILITFPWRWKCDVEPSI